MSLVAKLRKHGLVGSGRILTRVATKNVQRQYDGWRVRHAPRYVGPTPAEVLQIEQSLSNLGVKVQDYAPSPEHFRAFKSRGWFPEDRYGGPDSHLWDEKLLEHWIAMELLELPAWQPKDVYVDVAACRSPWAKLLREQLGISAFAIDMDAVGANYADLPYYRSENATRSSFEDESVRGASLQCAFEMFSGQDDRLLIPELARILTRRGKVVILPLYMHTHYCAYATPDFYGKGFADPGATEYVRTDCHGVPSSRKYDPAHLVNRVLEPAREIGLSYRLLALRNKQALGRNIYCHFILELEK